MKKILSVVTIIVVISMTGCFNNNIEGTDKDYTSSFYVMTKNIDNDKINYYEVSGIHKRKTEKFENEKFDEILKLNDNCFESYIDREKNKVLNSLNLDNCDIKNEKNEIVLINEKYEKILRVISSLEHPMFNIKIYRLGQSYFVTRAENVNLSTPYELYQFFDSGRLNLISKFSDEEIIGFKDKNLNSN